MTAIAPQSRRSWWMTLGLLAALAPCASAAGPLRNTVQTHDPFDVRLTQKNVGEPIFVVTSDGHRFTDARLVKGARSPMLIDVSVQCPDGYTEPFTDRIFTDGHLTQLKALSSGWFADVSIFGEWKGLFELFLNAISDIKGVEGEFNLLSEGADASFVRSIFNDLEPAVIQACNDALESKLDQGFSRATALSTIGTIDPLPQIAPEVLSATLWARCENKIFIVDESEEGEASYGDSFKHAETNPLRLRLPVLCESPITPPGPGADDLTVGFAVQEIELAPDQNPFKGECPLTVRLSGEAELTGPGTFRYRYRTGSGGLGPVATVQVTDSRTAVPLSLDFEVGGQPSGPGFRPTPPPGDPEPGGSLAVPGPDGDPAGPTLRARQGSTPPRPGASGEATATAPGQITDWVQIEVVEPSAGARASRKVFYKAICERNLAGAGGFRTEPKPDPGRFRAHPGAPSPIAPGSAPQPAAGERKRTKRAAPSSPPASPPKPGPALPAPAPAPAAKPPAPSAQPSAPAKQPSAPAAKPPAAPTAPAALARKPPAGSADKRTPGAAPPPSAEVRYSEGGQSRTYSVTVTAPDGSTVSLYRDPVRWAKAARQRLPGRGELARVGPVAPWHASALAAVRRALALVEEVEARRAGLTAEQAVGYEKRLGRLIRDLDAIRADLGTVRPRDEAAAEEVAACLTACDRAHPDAVDGWNRFLCKSPCTVRDARRR